VSKKSFPINLTGFAFAFAVAVIIEILARLGWLTSYVPPPSLMFVASGTASSTATSRVKSG
jgi:hypothetical protein